MLWMRWKDVYRVVQIAKRTQKEKHCKMRIAIDSRDTAQVPIKQRQHCAECVYGRMMTHVGPTTTITTIMMINEYERITVTTSASAYVQYMCSGHAITCANLMYNFDRIYCVCREWFFISFECYSIVGKLNIFLNETRYSLGYCASQTATKSCFIFCFVGREPIHWECEKKSEKFVAFFFVCFVAFLLLPPVLATCSAYFSAVTSR